MEANICRNCLGDEDALTKYANGTGCKICTGTFDLYVIKRRRSLTKTLICYHCSEQRNICQCCMLDLSWGIPMDLRDRLLSIMHDDPSLKTQEARNDMMRRFLALKQVKLGGAQITSESNSLEKLKPLLQLIKSFQVDLSPSDYYLISNVEKCIPDWKIESAVDDMMGTEGYIESLLVNRGARIGCMTVKEGLGIRLFEKIEKFKNGGKVRGKLVVDRFNIVITSLQKPVKLDEITEKLGFFLQKSVLFAETSDNRESLHKKRIHGNSGKVTKRSKRVSSGDLEL